MSEISDLYNLDLDVDVSAGSEDFVVPMPSRVLNKSPQIPVESPKNKAPKAKKLKTQDIIKQNKRLSDVFSTLQKTNQTFNDVIETVTCYRPELGRTLENIHVTFNKLFEEVLERTLEVISAKEKELGKMQKTHEQLIENQLKEKEEIQNKLFVKNKRIHVLKTRLKIATTSESALHDEIKQLRDILKYDQNATNILRTTLEKGRHEDDENTNEVKGVTEEPGLKLKLEELEKVISEIETGHETNFQTLNDMHGVLRSMAKSSTTMVDWTQTEEGELYWNLDPGAIVPVPVDPNSYYCLIKEVEGTGLNVTRPRPKNSDGVKWSLTPNIMRFLANSPSRMALPYPYAYFKKLLMEICIERLSINPEVCGYLQPLMPLDEFLCVFFLKKHQLRRLAEIKLKEFLGSLKYYMKWQRAALFSKVSGIAVDAFDNTDFLYTDYHTQMYFLFCIGVLYSEPTSVWESQEGHTWLKSTKEEALTLTAMPWVGKNDLRKIRKDVSYMTRTVTDLTGNEGEYIDIDQLIGYYIKEYITIRQANLDKLCKNFLKTDQVHQGLYNFDEFKFLLPNTEEQPIAESQVARAFYYSVTGGSNSFQISPNTFAAACIRFGFDNPCPLVQVGWDLIFPFPLIKYMVDNKEEKYSGLIFKKEKILAERSNYLKVPSKLNVTTKTETPTNTMSVEKIAALLAQHYGIIRELKKYTDQFKIALQKEGAENVGTNLEKLYSILNSACDFFTFPIVF